MPRYTLALSLGAIVTLAAVAFYLGADRLTTTSDAPSAASGSPHTLQSSDQQPLSEAERRITELAVALLEAYGEEIERITVQAKLLERRDAVIDRNPENGREHFRRAVHTAFPELADSILETINTMAQYREWVEANQRSLNEMGFWARQSTLWEKRRDLFGEDAEALWDEERRSAAEREEAMQAVLERLDASHETSLEEKLYQLDNALDEVYGYGVQRQAINTDTLAQTFFSLDSVQSELGSLPAEERQSAINEARRQLGYTEEQINRLEERDQQREQRWQAGYEYMQEREAITRQYSGEQREERLDELRREHFDHEAQTIALEEEDGFFRFERERVYGRN